MGKNNSIVEAIGNCKLVAVNFGRFLCKATPKNSGGEYLYVGVWQVPDM